MAKYFRMFIYIIKIFNFIQILKKKWAFGHKPSETASNQRFCVAKSKKKVGKKWPIGQIWPNPYRKIAQNFQIFGQKVASGQIQKHKSGHKKSPDRPFSRVYQDNLVTATLSFKCVIHGFL